MTSYEEFRKLMKYSDKGTQHGYQRFYYPIFKNLELSPIRLLEIGVKDGKSMKIWKTFFKNAEHIYGLGYKNYQTREVEKIDDHMTLFMGDQSSTNFLEKMISLSDGNFDIVIDDGSHVPSHVITSFEVLWKTLKPGGYYVIEDIETSYWKKSASVYGYKLTNQPSVIDYFTNKISDVNAEFIRGQAPSDIATISFMQNMIIIKKTTTEFTPYTNRPYRYQKHLP